MYRCQEVVLCAICPIFACVRIASPPPSFSVQPGAVVGGSGGKLRHTPISHGGVRQGEVVRGLLVMRTGS